MLLCVLFGVLFKLLFVEFVFVLSTVRDSERREFDMLFVFAFVLDVLIELCGFVGEFKNCSNVASLFVWFILLFGVVLLEFNAKDPRGSTLCPMIDGSEFALLLLEIFVAVLCE